MAAIIAADDPFGMALSNRFARDGWRVYRGAGSLIDLRSVSSVLEAAQPLAASIDNVDLLVVNVRGDRDNSTIDGFDSESIIDQYDAVGLGPLRVLEAFVPLMKSGGKRICFVTGVDGDVEAAEGVDRVGSRMAEAALRMSIAITSNRLRPEGFTFRVFPLAPEADSLEEMSAAAYAYFVGDRDEAA